MKLLEVITALTVLCEAAVHMENKLWYFCDAQKLQAYNKTTHNMYALVTIYKYRNLYPIHFLKIKILYP